MAVSVSLDGLANDGQASEGDRVATDVEGIIGGIAGDTLTGDANPNDIEGGDGGDVIDPRGGPDFVDAGAGTTGSQPVTAPSTGSSAALDNDQAIVDAFDVVVGCEDVQASRDLMPDIDADGVLAPADCDDRNAGRRPGNVDRPGNGVDEDCSGADAPFLRILSPIQSTFATFPRFTRGEPAASPGRARGWTDRGPLPRWQAARVLQGRQAVLRSATRWRPRHRALRAASQAASEGRDRGPGARRRLDRQGRALHGAQPQAAELAHPLPRAGPQNARSLSAHVAGD